MNPRTSVGVITVHNIRVLESVCNPCIPAEAGDREVPGEWQAAVLACAVGRQRPRSQLKLGEQEQHFEVVLRFPQHAVASTRTTFAHAFTHIHNTHMHTSSNYLYLLQSSLSSKF